MSNVVFLPVRHAESSAMARASQPPESCNAVQLQLVRLNRAFQQLDQVLVNSRDPTRDNG
jgi:hypothetical protein